MRGQRTFSTHRTPRRVNRVIVCVVLVAGCLLLVLFLGRWGTIGGLRNQLDELAAAQQTAVAEQQFLREQLKRTDDAQVIEENARERLGLVKPGEEKAIFVEE